MKKMLVSVVFGFAFVGAAFAAVGSAQEIPAPETLLAEPVRAAEAAEPEKTAPVTPAEKLAAEKGLTLDEAREILAAAGIDPDAVPATHAERAGFVDGEVVEINYATLWSNDPDHQRLINAYQGHGKYHRGDMKYLFAHGHRVIPHTDPNGHGDASSVIGTAFRGWKVVREKIAGKTVSKKIIEPRFIVDGLAVFSQSTAFVYDRNGAKRKAWFNIIVDARQPVPAADAEVSDKDLIGIINCRGVWNLRESFDPSTASYMEMTPEEWSDQEMTYAAFLNNNGGDPSFFVYYKAKPGEIIDLDVVDEAARVGGLYRSYSEIWGGDREPEGAKPRFASAKKSSKKR